MNQFPTNTSSKRYARLAFTRTAIAIALPWLFLVGCSASVKVGAGTPGKAGPADSDYEAPPVGSGVQSKMRAKLAHAQGVLEGIVMENYKQVRDNAMDLNALSKATDWDVARTIAYVRFSADFRRNTEEMAEHAKDKNLHGITLDYMQMTMICVKCHSYMRQEGLVQSDRPGGKLADFKLPPSEKEMLTLLSQTR